LIDKMLVQVTVGELLANIVYLSSIINYNNS
jgi:hypothetical protein